MSPTILLAGAPSFAVVQAAYEDTSGDRVKSTSQPGFVTAPTSQAVESSSVGHKPPASEGHQSKLGINNGVAPVQVATSSPDSTSLPQWRILRPESHALKTGLTQRDWLRHTPLEYARRSATKSASFVPASADISKTSTSFDTEFDESPADLSNAKDLDETAFLEQSFALHEYSDDHLETPATSHGIPSPFSNLLSTQSSGSGPLRQPSSPLAPKFARKGYTTPTTLDLPSRRPSIPTDPPNPLRALPTATDILRAAPSTLTANLLLGILAIEPIRTVTIRKSGRTVSLLEVLVADETHPSGFAVTFWLDDNNPQLDSHPSLRNTVPKSGLEATLDILRTGDVVLITNVALSQFRGRIQGSSLARRWWRTNVGLIWRRGTGWSVLGRELVRAEVWKDRVLVVRAWVERCVAVEGVGEGGGGVREGRGQGGGRGVVGKRWLPVDESQE